MLLAHSWFIVICLVLFCNSPFAQEQLLDESTTKLSNCIGTCNRKIRDEARTVCKKACEELLEVVKAKGFHNNTWNRDLLFNPDIPRLVSSRFRSLRLNWTNTSKSNLPVVRYILEIYPNRTESEGINIFPYIEKYRLTNESDYTVNNLLANTKYRFRVAKITLKMASFGEWSDIIRTSNSCDKKPCSITNLRLKLLPTTSKGNWPKLPGTFFWEPTTGLNTSNFPPRNSYYEIKPLSTEGLCKAKFPGVETYDKTGDVFELTSKNLSSHKFVERGSKAELYFGCNYSVEIGIVNSFINTKKRPMGSWIFKIPKCLSPPKVCGCKRKPPKVDINSTKIYWTRTTDITSSVNISWSDEIWSKETNITYFWVEISTAKKQYSKYVDGTKNVKTYNTSFPNVTNGKGYSLSLCVFHDSNCVYVTGTVIKFDVTYPCVSNPCLGANRTCQRNGYPHKDAFECLCDQGFHENNNMCEAKQGVRKSSTREVNVTLMIVVAVVSVPFIFAITIIIICLVRRRKTQIPELNWNSHDYVRELNPLYNYQTIIDAFREVSELQRFELPYENLKFDRTIGNGDFGVVYLGEAYNILERDGGTKVAIKMLPASASTHEIDDFAAEIKLMMKIGQHENVIEMYGCCTTAILPICLILAYASRGDLHSYLKSLNRKVCSSGYVTITANDDVRFGQQEFLSFSRQIANGMTYLADRGITHRDLAARNILLDENKVIKISDFGLSREGLYIKRRNGRVPFRWLSIEAIQDGIYDIKSDVWAFGVVLWEMCTLGIKPYASLSDSDLVDFLLNGKRLEKTANCSNEIYDAMLKCWSTQPDNRPTFLELLEFLLKLENTSKEPMYVNTEPRTSSAPYNTDNQGGNDENSVEQKF